MKVSSKLFKLGLLTLTVAALPVCAQDVAKIMFRQDGDKDKKCHRVIVDFTYKNECADLEKVCAKFFFSDSVSPSLEAAAKNYQSQFSESKTYRSVPDFAHRFKLAISSNSPGKYTNYLLERTNVTYDGDTQKQKSLSWNVVYDTQRDRLLTIDDIFIPQEAAKIKESIGNRRQQLLVSNEGLVWGYLLKGELVQNKCYYRKTPLIFTEEFRKLIGGNAFDHDAIFALDKNPEDYLRENLKYPEVALKNFEKGSVTVSFKIDADGRVMDAQVRDDNTPNLSAEVLRVVNSMPRWIPAVKDGENVVGRLQVLTANFPTEQADYAPLTDYLMKKMNNSTVNALAKQKKNIEILAVIEADGTVSSAKVKGNSSPLLAKELMRLLKGMPKCVPAKMHDVAIRSQADVPMKFTLDGTKVVTELVTNVTYSSPVITRDESEALDEEIKSIDRNAASKGAFEVEGQPSSGVVLKAKEVVSSSDGKYYDVIDEMPSFPGGQGALFQWLASNIKYPPVAEENGVQGRVILTFVVERDGSISDVQVVKSVDPALDKEAVRLAKSMPKWIPGKLNGSAVRVRYDLPVTFRLQ